MISCTIRKAGSNRVPLPPFLACATLAALVGVALAQLAPGEKLLYVRDAERIQDAVMITNISVAGKTIECGLWVKWPAVIQPVTPFQADGDWLRQTTITLFNRTNKTIVFGSILLQFLDTGDCKSVPCSGATVEFGQRPAIDAYDGRTGRPAKLAHPEMPPLDWKPLHTLVVRIGDHMDDIERSTLIDRMPVTEVTRVNLYRGPFFFDDGMQWNGTFSVPDPERPGKFNQLPFGYFPGARERNLPPEYNP